ncbi:hypothetical protein O181_068853 [Austropuccinia psidii MF-1]|uniref:Uncharacterized protein n=1 Tax=Austropuccinia psidii MF-1 TaxID=1389203 RepID=A0A9Q3F156_9BASI|nr:hypothetical protein [Austropuccinia psidii MF-1]
MEKRFKLASHCKEVGAGSQKIFLKDIPFKDLIIITKGRNPNRKFKLLEEREARIRENQATIQAIEEQLNLTEHTLISSYSRRKPTRLPSGFTPLRNQEISDQERPLFTIPGTFQEKARIKREIQDLF